MDYRMYSDDISAGVDVIELIKKSLKKEGITINTPLRFIGFEGEVGTSFILNNKNKMKIPTSGKFITPFNGEYGMSIYSLKFDTDFSGDIYYII